MNTQLIFLSLSVFLAAGHTSLVRDERRGATVAPDGEISTFSEEELDDQELGDIEENENDDLHASSDLALLEEFDDEETYSMHSELRVGTGGQNWQRVGKGGEADEAPSENCAPSNRSYKFLSGGWCTDYIYLPGHKAYPDFLSSDSPLSSKCHVRECMDRCLCAAQHDANVGTLAFYVDPEGRCSCAKEDCKERKDRTWGESYAILPPGQQDTSATPSSDEAPCKLGRGKTYAFIGEGECDDKKYLPDHEKHGKNKGFAPLLEESSPMYNANRVKECMNRCLCEAQSDPKHYGQHAFYINPEGQCACSKSYCEKRKHPTKGQAYRIIEDNKTLKEECDPQCKECDSLGRCRECNDGKYLLSADWSCADRCPPGFYKRLDSRRSSTRFESEKENGYCDACMGSTRRREPGARREMCSHCPPGEVSKTDSDDCQNLQDTCTHLQCKACEQCMSKVAPLWAQCIESTDPDATCVNPGTQWCAPVIEQVARCKSLSLGCYYKLNCHNPCICASWKSVFCGGRVTNGECNPDAYTNASSWMLLERAVADDASGHTSNIKTQDLNGLDATLQDKCGGVDMR